MDKDILDMFNLLIDKMDGMETRMVGMGTKMDGMETRMDKKLAESETRIMVYIENNVGKRLDALMDGYKTNYEQNNETAQRLDVLADKIDTLQDRVTILENAG